MEKEKDGLTCNHVIEGKPCGAEIQPNSKFCDECGKAVTAPSIRCPGKGGPCAAILSQGKKFCSKCGLQITDKLWKEAKIDIPVVIKYCECGSPVGAEELYCSECGAAQSRPLVKTDSRSLDGSIHPDKETTTTQQLPTRKDVNENKKKHREISDKNSTKGLNQTAGMDLNTAQEPVDNRESNAFMEAINKQMLTEPKGTQSKGTAEDFTTNPESSKDLSLDSSGKTGKNLGASNEGPGKTKHARHQSGSVDEESHEKTRGIYASNEVNIHSNQSMKGIPEGSAIESGANLPTNSGHGDLTISGVPQNQPIESDSQVIDHSRLKEQQQHSNDDTDKMNRITYPPGTSVTTIGKNERGDLNGNAEPVGQNHDAKYISPGMDKQNTRHNQHNTEIDQKSIDEDLTTKSESQQMQGKPVFGECQQQKKARPTPGDKTYAEVTGTTSSDREMNKNNNEHSGNLSNVDPGQTGPNTNGKYYRKPEADNSQYVPPQTRSETNQAKKELKKEVIKVHFHVVVSKDFHLKMGKEDVLIRFDHVQLGNWGADNYVMTCKRDLGGGYYLMQLTVPMPKEILSHGKLINYKYLIKRTKKYDWEFINRRTYHGQDANRNFHIPREQHQTIEEWYQYDALMYPEPSTAFGDVVGSFFKKLSGQSYKKICKESQMAVKEMLPDWSYLGINGDPPTITAESFLVNVNRILKTSKWNFWNEDGNSIDEKNYAEIFYEFIQPAIKNFEGLRERKSETQEEASSRLAAALCIVYIILEYGLQYSRNFTTPLFDALSIFIAPDQWIDVDSFVKFHFPNKKTELTNSLGKFLYQMSRHDFNEPKWFYAVPLFHFLCGDCEPFVTLESNKHTTAEWWGTKRLTKLIENYQWNYGKNMPVKEYVEDLSPMFSADPLLPRTLVAVVGFQNFPTLLEHSNISPEIYLASLYYNVASKKIYMEHREMLKDILDQIAVRLQSMDSNIQTEKVTLESVHKEMSTCQIATELLSVAWPALSYATSSAQYQLIISTLRVLVAGLCGLEHTCSAAEKMELPVSETLHSPSIEKYMITMVESTFNILDSWLNYILKPSFCAIGYVAIRDPNELKIYNELLCLEWSNVEMTNLFKEQVLGFLQKRIQTMKPKEKIEFFCSYSFENLDKEIEECFSKAAFQTLDKNLMTTGMTGFLFEGYSKYDQIKLRNMLSAIFSKMWESSVGDKPSRILKHITSWPTFTRYASPAYGKSELIDGSCETQIVTGLSVFDNAMKELVCGEIKMSDLKIVIQQQAQVIELYKVVESASNEPIIPQPADKNISKVQLLIEVIHHRKKEVEAINRLKLQIENFVTICKDTGTAKYNFLPLLEQQMQLKFEDCKLSKLCTPGPVTSNGVSGQPMVIFFGLSPTVKDMLAGLDKVKSSLVFKKLWEKMSESAIGDDDEEELDIDEFVSAVWEPAYAEFMKIARDVSSGNMSFGQVDDVFSRFKTDYAQIQKELKYLCDKRRIVGERLSQIERYHTLDQYQSGAKVMLDVKNQFGLKGDFTIVETLAKAGQDKKERLNKMNEELVVAGKELFEITADKQKAIEVFSKCQSLIQWLKESIKGPKEVKVLVDLAMISATGEGDLEVQRVSCLHAAVTGYAPLIYDLNQTADFNTFLGLCRLVWQALKADENLPKKLEDTNRNLTWLKNIKDSHGSVEVNALFQAESINSRGIFQVGNIREDTNKTLANSIILKVPPDENDKEGRKEWKEYTLSQLNDLQSKLMLVAGKGEKGRDKVERFVEIYDGITRLANTYVKICAAGSILFQKWKATFYCEPDRNVSVSIELGLSQRKLQGSKMEVTKQIQDVCKFMEECLGDWLRHIEKQRTQFCYLNHFTTTQLVILSSELAKLAFTKEGLSHVVYPMLSCVKADCSETDVRKAIQEALTEMEPTQEMQERADMDHEIPPDIEGEIDLSEEDTNTDANDMQLRDKFIAKMEESGFRRKLAERALTELSADQIDEGIMWCLEHDEEESEELSDEEDLIVSVKENNVEPYMAPEPAITRDTYSLGMLTETLLLATEEGSSLKSQLEQLWTGFLDKVDTSVYDYLSIDHLGGVLEELARIGNKQIDRSLPNYLTLGKPNLIICNESDMFLTVLSIYMNHDGRDLPLPGPDEVLLCSEETTAEEVDLLWRRAMEDRDRKIFCLVAADLLDYDVSQKAEQRLEKHQHGNTDYKLVVLCSHEREDKAHLVTALDRHRVNHPIQEPIEDIRKYLQKHFTVNESSMLNKPAAFIDPQNLCVRLIKSHRAGVGKSHRVRRLREKMETLNPDVRADSLPISVTIQLQRKKVDISAVLKTLVSYTTEPQDQTPRLFHFDIGHNVQEEVDYLLFNLLVLGSLTDSSGYVWLRSPSDIYVVETMPLMQADVKAKERVKMEALYVHHILALLPSTTCWSPMDSLNILTGNQIETTDKYVGAQIGKDDQLMDKQEFESPDFQRPYQYLKKFDEKQDPNMVNVYQPSGSIEDCLRILMKYCGLQDPSWSELRHFVSFLNTQLQACEGSTYCIPLVAEDLPGFLLFVIKFMIQMSRDFATRSLNMSEETPGVEREQEQQNDKDIIQYILKKRWETSPHPYVFFNSDGHTLTFLGFFVNRQTGDIHDPMTNTILQTGVMPRPLQDGLTRNRVALNENFDALPRLEKIQKMCYVMGIEFPYDPDPTYELTTDNVKKILAIYMRFRCGIPVVIMGETGCGKTRLIRFMCDLQKPPGVELKNMVLMKVHGGTTERDIQRKVEEASRLAKENRAHGNVDTVLFFDEANTTEAIGMIKEIMCDGTINGHPLQTIRGLKLVAACNPYRKHSDEMIRRLEQAGLGYHVQAEQTRDKLGRIPMRQLVYRVQALPRSMLPLVWDFGQLSTQVEELYIKQMVLRFVGNEEEGKLPHLPNISQVISSILAASQAFMRWQQDECSFVSLRDVERVMNVMMWFYGHRTTLFELINERAQDYLGWRGEDIEYQPPSDETRALILALGVCYHACLQNRRGYRECVAKKFQMPCCLVGGPESILREITWCQDVFLDSVELGPNIARNKALKENLFMMVVCIELRIPLFLVGKPGSSKSLAKTIVADAMQGDAAHFRLFKSFKLVHMVSFQCSPLSTPDGIVGTFRQCAKLQQEKDLDKFVSVVVLDEVGLAEDSPRMPLKTLHPLLEDGCEGDEEPQPYKKVAFIGISNWALDPAKMNRGIHVQRGIPDEEELVHSAKGICATDETVLSRISRLMKPMSQAYLELYSSALEIREFFGLRDFYGLVKMVYGFSKRSRADPTWYELQHAVLRNFGGLDKVKPLDVFDRKIKGIDKTAEPTETDPECNATALIKAGLRGDGLDSESRYLLVLTENYAALGLLEHHLLIMKDTVVIFGSSFPKDQEYTQVCRNINKIKVCMETGKTVVLLNLENLYESLYDALNQYYVYLGGDRFVDLGLGTQRVKCRVHKTFRLIVVAEKQVVYKTFPIPLINRLEKHFLAMSTVLTPGQIRVVGKLEEWAKQFAIMDRKGQALNRKQKLTVGDVFIGYNADTAASIILQACLDLQLEVDDRNENTDAQILEKAQDILMQCCTPDAIIRLKDTELCDTEGKLNHQYFDEQKHDNLLEFLQAEVSQVKAKEGIFAQVTTHSRLLSGESAKAIGKRLIISPRNVHLVPLQAFDTEQQFTNVLRDFFKTTENKKDRIMLLQCDSGDKNGDLIACARHIIWGEFLENNDNILAENVRTHVVFIIQLPRIAGGCFSGFEGGRWTSYHIDELLPTNCDMPSISDLKETSVSKLFEPYTDMKEEASSEDDGDIEEFDDNLALESSYLSRGSAPRDEVLPAEEMNFDGGVEDMNEDENIINPEDVEVDMEVTEDVQPPTETCTMHNQFSGIRSTKAVEVPPCTVGLGELSNEVEKAKRRTVGEMLNKTREALVGKKNKLDVERLISNCVHSAGAMLKDPEPRRQRKTHRVQLLTKLLVKSDPDDMCLMEVLKKRIYHLMKEKEESVMTGTLATSWLSKEVASVEAINRAGTLSRSLLQYFESKVTPLLAGLVAYMDTNGNLDILEKAIEEKNQTITELWLSLMESKKGCVLSFRDFQSGTQRSDLTEFQVHSKGCDGHLFDAVCPFSWVIKSHIDMLVYQAATVKKIEINEEVISNLLNSSPLGVVLKKVVDEDARADLIQRYLHDYIHMVYKPQSGNSAEKEYKLVTEAVCCAARENHIRIHQHMEEIPPFTLTIPGIHLAFQQAQKRLMLFSETVQLWPECVPRLAQFAESADNIWLTEQEMTLDVQLLCLVLEDLTPSKEQLDNFNNRKEWSRRAEMFHTVIEMMLSSVENNDPYHPMFGVVSVDTCTRSRPIWTKICVIELFIRHVCPADEKDAYLSVKKMMPLWNMLKEDTDFKKAESLAKVENFLKLCNKTASSHFFGEKKTCPSCKEPMSNPVQFNCKHICCERCVLEMINLQDYTCPECREKFPDNFQPVTMKDKKEAIDGHNEYKRRCNAFFMELVSTLCFSGDTPPEPEVINKLMGYVTRERHGKKETKKLTVFEESIDPTPVVRSFLLQLLLRSNINDVREYLQEYFERTSHLTTNDEELIEFGILCVHCLEDYHQNEASQKEPGDVLRYAGEILSLFSNSFQTGDEVIDKLEAIGGTRCGLGIIAKYIHQKFIKDEDTDGIHPIEVREFLMAAQNVCCQENFKWPRLYLMKLLNTNYGMECLRTIGNVETLQWIIPPEARENQDDARPDRFVTCGADYAKIRDVLAEVTMGRDIKDLSSLLKEIKGPNVNKERALLLALQREVTASHGNPLAQQWPTEQMLETLVTFVEAEKAVAQKNVAESLIRNTFGESCTLIKAAPNHNPAVLDVVEVAIHLFTVLQSTKENKLLQPLKALITNPATMQGTFLPTMPEDYLSEVREALLANRGHGNENPTMYQCPKGHPYVIGNCGRPATFGTCLTCGAKIGGQGYTPAAGNTQAWQGDRTAKGHVLGEAQQRDKNPQTERELSPGSCSLLRLLLHLSMYLGANTHLGDITAMIQAPIQPALLQQYLMHHIECDLETLSNALQRGRDDVLLLLHLVVENISKASPNVAKNLDNTWQSKQSRKSWERAFADGYIKPVFAALNEKLNEANQALMNDTRLANNPLVRALYEVEVEPPRDAHLTQFEMVPTFWKFQQKITIQHLRHELNEKESTQKTGKKQKKLARGNDYKILHLFLEQDHQLRLVRLLPGIIKLQKLLVQRYHRNIDGSEATSLRVRDFLAKLPNDHQREEVYILLDHFKIAWDFVRKQLDNFVLGGMRVPEQYCTQGIDDQTSLAMILPSWKGQGICALAVTHYLAAVHNNFIDEYARIKGQSVTRIVDIGDATPTHLVAYHPEKDLLPIILANCNYSLAIGSKTIIDYDFKGLQKLVEERFIKGRPRINPQIDVVVFREDYTNAAVFEQLRTKIPQEPLLQTTQHQLQSEFKHLSDLWENLANVDICIGFLVSVGGDPEKKLVSFMTETLKMETGMLSNKAGQCRQKHVESLWLVMSHERAKMLASYGQDPFDAEDKYLEAIPQGRAKELDKLLSNINLEVFLYQLFEAIVLQLTIKRNINDEDYVDNVDYPLYYVLHEFIEGRDGVEIPALKDGRFPQELCVNHAIATWRRALHFYNQQAKRM